MRWWALAAWLVVASGSRDALAEEKRALDEAITVDQPRCLTKTAIVEQLRAWLGSDTLDARIAVSISEPTEGHASFVLKRLGEVVGERDFSDIASCKEMRALVSLAVAVAIDQTLLEGDSAPVPRAPATAPVIAQPPRPTTKAARRNAAVSVDAIASLGRLPAAAFGADVALEWMATDSFVLRGGGSAEQSLTTSLGVGSAKTWLFAARVDGCARARSSTLDGRACIGLGLGEATAQGSGYATPMQSSALWAATYLRFDLRWLLSTAFALGLALDVTIPFTPVHLEVLASDGTTVVAQDAFPVGLALGLGPSLSF